MKRAILAAALLSGCFQEIPTDIPCSGDLTCPTGFWCGSTGTCQDESVTRPPELALAGVSDNTNGPFETVVTIPRNGGTVALRITNSGGAQAAYPDILLAGPACFDVDGDIASNLVGIIDPGQTVVARQTVVKPTAPCPSATVTVTLKLSEGPSSRRFERVWTGTFTAVLGP